MGLNNNGQAVGATTGGIGEAHGFVYDLSSGSIDFVNVPGASKRAAFGVRGATVNGIDDQGNLVGFYSDGTKVHGFLALPISTSNADGSN